MPKNAPNGCSGGVSWFYNKILNRQVPWCKCCYDHDIEYIYHTMTRLDSDRKFRDCVIAEGRPIRAWIMYVIIRAFGWAWYYT